MRITQRVAAYVVLVGAGGVRTAIDKSHADSYRFENVADAFPDVPLLAEGDR